MKYLIFWAVATVYCNNPFYGFCLMLLAALLFEPDSPKEEPAKKE